MYKQIKSDVSTYAEKLKKLLDFRLPPPTSLAAEGHNLNHLCLFNCP